MVYTLCSLFFFITLSSYSQTARLTGNVYDKNTNEKLIGVSIITNKATGSGVTTDLNGSFAIDLEAGQHYLKFIFVGYTTLTKKVKLEQGSKKTINIFMEETSRVLDEVVVSAGRFEQKLSDVTVSMEVIPASMIENTHTQSIETVVQQVPGIMIMDDQASIRGGSSYSYGAGSRVLLLVDDMPMLSASVGDIKWHFAPVENIRQIEILKGASSALYGSSALNGVIHIRTKYPSLQPETRLTFSSGLYMNPKRKKTAPWGKKNPIFTSTGFSHSRQINHFDLVVGGQFLSNNGYRENDSEQRGRLNFNTRWRHKDIEGLTYGLNMNFMKLQGAKFLLWLDGDEGIYRANESWDHEFNNMRLNIDPYITYYTEKGNRHSLKTRFFRTENHNNTGQNNDDNLYFAEYQYQRHIANNLSWTSGITGSYIESFAEIYGNTNHFGRSGAIYSQLDKKFNRLSVSIGGRWEAYKMTDDKTDARPVLRSGINYQLFNHTFLRASYGQGYRYPSIAEKYIHSSVDALNIFPNKNLQPEYGWGSEVGIKQGFSINNWHGYLDIAGFWTEYNDMIEFSFGYHFPEHLEGQTSFHPDTIFKYIGFKAQNVSNARITGVDVSVVGHGNIFGIATSLMAGYTYTNPIDLNISEEDRKKTTDNSHLLKYRFYHNAKADMEMQYKSITWGFSIQYFSFIHNIDKAFEDTMRFPNDAPIIFDGEPLYILPGLYEYRKKNNTGTFVLDCRLGVKLSSKSRISAILRNALNNEYMIRPGDVQPPRSFALQYVLRL